MDTTKEGTMTRREQVLQFLADNDGSYESSEGGITAMLADKFGASVPTMNQVILKMRNKDEIEQTVERGLGTTRIALASTNPNPTAAKTKTAKAAAPSATAKTKASVPPTPPDAAVPATMRASDMNVARISLVWRDRFPAAALTVIAGPPGMGKSTLEAAIASELTNEGMTGIISNLEDDPESVVVPRLCVAGADMDKVLILRPEAAPKLPAQFDKLAALVRDTGARFIILDPIAAHFYPERRLHDRSALADLMALARATQCAIIGIHHTVKSGRSGGRKQQASAIEAIGGPQGGLSGAARGVYIYGFDPNDEDRRALACVKLNGMDNPATLLVEHETVEGSVNDTLFDAGCLRIVGESNIPAEDILWRGSKNRDRDAECAEWLTKFIASGDACAQQANSVRIAGTALGFGWQTIVRAGVELQMEKKTLGIGADQFVVWRLPDDHPLRKAAALPKKSDDAGS